MLYLVACSGFWLTDMDESVAVVVCLGCCVDVVKGVGSFSVFVGDSEGTS